jgi:hypothetical protein
MPGTTATFSDAFHPEVSVQTMLPVTHRGICSGLLAGLVGANHWLKLKVHSPWSVLTVTSLRGLQAITG